MVQHSFSILFLLVLAAGAFSLVRTLRESWADICAALAPRPALATASVYSTTTLPAAEVPWVAQRLVLRELDEALPEPVSFAAWVARPVAFSD